MPPFWEPLGAVPRSRLPGSRLSHARPPDIVMPTFALGSSGRSNAAWPNSKSHKLKKVRIPMNKAQCTCGAITLSLREPSKLVVACHCIDCQRRTGAPFGVGAFYSAEAVTVSGTPKEFSRIAASGGTVRNYFCPDCGSTLYWTADNLPALIGVAVGAISDPGYPGPVRSVFERSKHAWVGIGDAGVEHFQQSSAPARSKLAQSRKNLSS